MDDLAVLRKVHYDAQKKAHKQTHLLQTKYASAAKKYVGKIMKKRDHVAALLKKRSKDLVAANAETAGLKGQLDKANCVAKLMKKQLAEEKERNKEASGNVAKMFEITHKTLYPHDLMQNELLRQREAVMVGVPATSLSMVTEPVTNLFTTSSQPMEITQMVTENVPGNGVAKKVSQPVVKIPLVKTPLAKVSSMKNPLFAQKKNAAQPLEKSANVVGNVATPTTTPTVMPAAKPAATPATTPNAAPVATPAAKVNKPAWLGSNEI